MKRGRKVLLWTPRLLLSAFALFLVAFSFDVFEDGKSAVDIGIAFVVHNIPTLLLGLVIVAAWRHEWFGVLSCLALAAAYLAWFWGKFPAVVYVTMTGPLLLVAALYAVNWELRRRTDRVP